MTIPNLGSIQEILNNNIVPVHELEKAFAGTADAPSTDTQVIDVLARGGVLTPFQAQAVREGRASELVMGNYIILDKLGAGGMGAVYKARHRRMKRIAALKVLKKELVGSADSVLRFQREVETSARCSHPGVVGVYDADEGPLGHFLAMEFVDGTDLAGLVMKRGPLPVAEAVDFIAQSARAMAYVHSRGLVHRDIKPANFLVDKSGTVKVADLGLVRISDGTDSSEAADQESLTQAYTIAGTLEFMAPEQAVDTKTADHRADIYSLGCTLWYLLTGKNVYAAKTQMQKIMAHQKEPIPSLTQARGDAPPALDAIFRKMVEKDVSKRYQSMQEVADDLSKLNLAPASDTVSGEEAGATMVMEGGIAALAAASSMANSPETIVGGQSSSTVVVVVESSDFLLKRMVKEAQALGADEVVAAKNIMQAQEALHDKPGVRLVIASNTLADGSGLDLLRQMRSEDSTRDIEFVLATSDEPVGSVLQGFAKSVVISKTNIKAHVQELAGKWASPAKAAKSVSDMAVLIADDSLFARRRLETAVRDMGFKQVTIVKDGAEAIEKIDSGTFDIIISDFNMPHHTGDQVASRAKRSALNSKTPILMYTSETEDHILESARKSGVDKILPKNATTEQVQEGVRRLLGLN